MGGFGPLWIKDGLAMRGGNPVTILHNVGPLHEALHELRGGPEGEKLQQRNPFSNQGLGHGGLMAWWRCWG